jgi:hypothetical protein
MVEKVTGVYLLHHVLSLDTPVTFSTMCSLWTLQLPSPPCVLSRHSSYLLHHVFSPDIPVTFSTMCSLWTLQLPSPPCVLSGHSSYLLHHVFSLDTPVTFSTMCSGVSREHMVEKVTGVSRENTWWRR